MLDRILIKQFVENLLTIIWQFFFVLLLLKKDLHWARFLRSLHENDRNFSKTKRFKILSNNFLYFKFRVLKKKFQIGAEREEVLEHLKMSHFSIVIVKKTIVNKF